MSPRDRALLVTASTLFALDQATKLATTWWIPQDGGRIWIVDGWLALVHVRNHAAAFGLTGDMPVTARRLLYAVTTVAMLGGVAIVRRQMPAADRVGGVAMGLGVAGVLGNAWDRLVRGSVVDMVEMTAGSPGLARVAREWLGTATWPVYNVADVLLGAAGLAIAAWLIQPDEPALDDPPTLGPSEPVSSPTDRDGTPG